jgi:hypothetical protein
MEGRENRKEGRRLSGRNTGKVRREKDKRNRKKEKQ